MIHPLLAAARPQNRISRMSRLNRACVSGLTPHPFLNPLNAPQVVYEGDGGDIVTAEEQRQRKSRYLKLKVGDCTQAGLNWNCQLLRVKVADARQPWFGST